MPRKGVCVCGRILWYLGRLANKDTAMYRRPSELAVIIQRRKGAGGEANMHEISIKFPHILPFSLSQQHCYFPPRLALPRRPSVRPYIFPPRPRPSVEREIQMDIVLSPGINHIRCSSGEGRRKDWTGAGRERGRKRADCDCRADFAGIFTVGAGF